MSTTTRPSINLKNRSSGDSQTLMDYASKHIQGAMILELTRHEACFYKSLDGANPRLKSFYCQLSRRCKNVTRCAFSPLPLQRGGSNFLTRPLHAYRRKHSINRAT